MSLLLALGLGVALPVDAKKEHILPIPQQLTSVDGKLTIPAASAVMVTGIGNSPALVKFFNEFGITDVQFSEVALGGNVFVKMVKEIKGAYDYQLDGYGNEAYTLKVTSAGIEISAVSELGVIRAAQTLTQLAEGYEGKGVNLEYVDITDWPAFKLRGYMHDIGRSYMSVDMIKRHIDLLSRFKVNTFHWHFTENQGFRFEVKAYPQLNKAEFMTRDAGKFYTQKECQEVEQYAYERGVIVIPEIDMPGHSAAFERAMGFDMQSAQGKNVLKQVLDEVGQTFVRAPYIHIGADEYQTTPAYVNEMIDYVKEKVGRKCVIWNPMRGVGGSQTHADMCQLWSTAGAAVQGKANIDCRYNYTNHFDVFADLVGIYKSNIYYQQRGNATVAGTISGMWNDRRLENEHQIVAQNNFYANVIASASRAWQGGGEQYIDKENRGGKIGGGVMLPNSGKEYDDFKNWESRFLFHKSHCLAGVAKDIPYVKQTNVRWRISDAFNNGGDVNKVFPPEEMKDQEGVLPDSYTYEGVTYGTGIATGAGIYLRHTWGQNIISAYFQNAAYNQTAYAWTYVYSDKKQKVGAQIEFQNYSRSELDPVPAAGNWDLMGSKIWINGKAIAAPKYKNAGVSLTDKEVLQKDENFAARTPIAVELQKGWNKVFMKLPYINAGYRLDKWMFTCVFTDLEGKAAVEGLIYSPNQCMDEAAEKVAAKVAELKTYRNSVIKEQPGYLAPDVAVGLDAEIKKIEATFNKQMTAAERDAQIKALDVALEKFKKACETAELLMPEVSGDQDYYYTLSTPLRENRYATSTGAGADMVGQTNATKSSYWKFVNRSDGDLDLINYNGTFVSPESANNTALKTQAASPTKGWKLGKADALGYFIITSGKAQFNQTNNAQLGYKVYNWGDGSNTNDTGCKYAIKAVSLDDFEVDPAFPVAGKLYYFINKHQAGDQYFYDNNGKVGFSLQKIEKNKKYVWKCEDAGNGNYYFKNLGTSQYFAWRSLSATACEWALSSAKEGTAKVSNDGCVSMQAVHQEGSNFMVCKQGTFDQANKAGFYNATFSSDFRFELCTNTDWEDESPVEVSYYSKKFGDNWVRISWNNNSNDAAGLSSASEEYLNLAAKSNPSDLTEKNQLWALVGNEKDGFYLQNASAGADYALNVSATASGTAATLVATAEACKWVLVEKGSAFAISPVEDKSVSLNSYGGARMDLKLYDANDPGSKWNLQSGIVAGFQMSTVIEGEGAPVDKNIFVGELRFVINGAAATSVVTGEGSAEATYYLPQKAQIMLSQVRAYRGYSLGGFLVNDKAVEQVKFTVGENSSVVKSIFNYAPETGLCLYRTPGPDGKPYRIPAIATAKNGDILAISDFRPCGRDIGFGEVDVKCRISKDNGRTWGPEFFIADGLGDNNGGEVWKTGFGDAAFVADAERNEVLIMMVCGKTVCWDGNYIPNSDKSNPNRVAQVRGKLNEETGEWEFTEPKEVTESIYPLFVQNGHATVTSLFIGSGRICQSRTIKVGDYYRLYCATWTKNEGNRVIYSDDFGETWHILGKVMDRPGRDGDEPKCEELPNGSVLLSSRRTGRLFNIFQYSDAAKGTGRWLGAVNSDSQAGGIRVGNSTNGEIMILKAVRKNDGKKVDLALQSVPFGGTRCDVGFFFKEINMLACRAPRIFAGNWTKGLQVSHDNSAYSTMTLQQDHKIGFYFEEAPGEYCMIYIPLTVEQITEGQYALDEEAYQTGIGGITVDKVAENEIYDLSGRQVMHPEKGVYVVNGEKILKK